MRKFNMAKLATLPTANEMLDKKYGAEGTESRAHFDAESKDAEVQENGFNFDISSIINSDMVILNLKK